MLADGQVTVLDTLMLIIRAEVVSIKVEAF